MRTRTPSWLPALLLAAVLTAPLAQGADTPPSPAPPAPAPAPAPTPAPAPDATAPHPILGVTVDNSDSSAALMASGALAPPAVIATVLKNSCADKMGIKPGDTITSIDGGTVKDFGEVVTAIRKHRIGDPITVVVSRGGASLTLTGTMQGAPTASGSGKDPEVVP